jgi:small subunit ribosomal protein S18
MGRRKEPSLDEENSRSTMAEETKAPAAMAEATGSGTRPAERSGGENRPERSERSDRGPRGPRPGGGPGGSREGGRKYFRRKKVCKFCVEKIEAVNYKDVRLLAQFVAESGKIVPRRLTGVCTPHQRRLSAAIKRARNIALLPFAGRAQ